MLRLAFNKNVKYFNYRSSFLKWRFWNIR